MAVLISPPRPVELYLQSVFDQTDRVFAVGDLPTAQQWQDWVSRWLECLADDLPDADAYELTLRLTDDQEIQQLNAQYRQQNKPTDVLAFATLEAELPDYQTFEQREPLYLGDIVISVPTAYRQATESPNPPLLTAELAWLAAHGLLHLLGWDHPDEESLQGMLAKQAYLLSQVGLQTRFDF